MRKNTLKKYTQKALKNLVNNGLAIDASLADVEQCMEIHKKECGLVKVGYSAGSIGCNGLLFEGRETGRLYAVIGRTPALWSIDY